MSTQDLVRMLAMDPAGSRGYRIGQRITLAPGESRLIINYGQADKFHRWKFTFAVEANSEETYPIRTAQMVQFEIIAKTENDRIRRRVAVQQDNARVIYAPGRSIEVVASNPSPRSIDVEFSVDEAAAGLSSWEWTEDLVNAAAGVEFDLDVPEFCVSITLLGLSGAPGMSLQGYNSLGNLVYNETLGSPRSAEVGIVPGLFYTATPVGPGSLNGMIFYRCAG